MSKPTSILVLIVIVLALVALSFWWLAARQTTDIDSDLTDNQTVQSQSLPSEAQNPSTRPPDGQTDTAGSGNSAAANVLTNGNADEDIANDLSNVDSQITTIDQDISESTQTGDTAMIE